MSDFEPSKGDSKAADIHKGDNGQLDVWLSTIGSLLLLGANVWMISIYYRLFGFHLWGDTPEHWQWMGGLLGILAVLARMAIVGIFACPFTISSLVGIRMAKRVAKNTSGIISIFSWLIALCHLVLLTPLVFFSLLVVFQLLIPQ